MNAQGTSEPRHEEARRYWLERNHDEVDDHQPSNQSNALPAGGSRRDVCRILSLSPLGGLVRQTYDAARAGT